jgi:hypothetical protein
MSRPGHGHGVIFPAVVISLLLTGAQATWAAGRPGHEADRADEAVSSSYGYAPSHPREAGPPAETRPSRDGPARADGAPSGHRQEGEYRQPPAEARSVGRETRTGDSANEIGAREDHRDDGYRSDRRADRYGERRDRGSGGYVFQAYAPVTDDGDAYENAPDGSYAPEGYAAQPDGPQPYAQQGYAQPAYVQSGDDGVSQPADEPAVEDRYGPSRAEDVEMGEADETPQAYPPRTYVSRTVTREERRESVIRYSERRIVAEPESLHLSDDFFIGGGGVGPQVVDYGGGGGGGFVLAEGSAGASASVSVRASARAQVAVMARRPMMKHSYGGGCGCRK